MAQASQSPFLVLGKAGQVGSAWLELLERRGVPAEGLDYPEVDFTRPGTLPPLLERLRPAAVVNAAAYTQVDRAEEEVSRARLINADSPGELARWCASRGVPLVHYSTDYVYDGSGVEPKGEDAPVAPLNAYGRTKLEGDQAIAAAGGKWLVFRTSWVYAASGKNFVNTMLRLGREREELKVVADQHGAPTYAPHLALASWEALRRALELPEFPSGVYHLCNSGETTWHGFAEAIFERARARDVPLRVSRVEATPSSAYPTPAKRPSNSRLSMNKARAVLGVVMPDWRRGLAECMEQIKV